jgi:hypothetical protein
MTLPDAMTAVTAILNNENACHVPELINRAYQLGFREQTIRPAYLKLQQEKKVTFTKTQAPDAKGTTISFIHRTDLPQHIVDQVIDEKARLLAKHYDLSNEVGHHGENLVGDVCSGLGYTDIEIRKEKDGTAELGIVGIHRRDIDVFAKHPSGNYYQNIEVKNRRDPLKDADLSAILAATTLANSLWPYTLHSAVVTTFAVKSAKDTATLLDIPIAYSGGVYVPENHRTLYEELNSRLALNVKITDHPTAELQRNIATYILQHTYST